MVEFEYIKHATNPRLAEMLEDLSIRLRNNPEDSILLKEASRRLKTFKYINQ